MEVGRANLREPRVCHAVNILVTTKVSVLDATGAAILQMVADVVVAEEVDTGTSIMGGDENIAIETSFRNGYPESTKLNATNQEKGEQ